MSRPGGERGRLVGVRQTWRIADRGDAPAAAPTSHDQYLALRRFPALDGLRAVAAGMVVMHHYGGVRWSWLSGWTGVHMFFVLSGFLITTLLLREEAGSGRVLLGAFWVRRVFRILPVYFVVLAAAVALAATSPAWWAPMARSLPYYLTVQGDLGPVEGMFGVSWTIGIEEKFYLVWPLLGFGLIVTASRRLALAGGLVVLVLGLTTVGTGYWVHYAVLLTGCVVALVLHQPRGWRALGRLTRPGPAVCAAVVFVAAQVGVAPLARAIDSEVWVIPLYGLACAALLVSLLGSGPVARVLATRAMTWVGERSYSLYLVQQFAAVGALTVWPALAGRLTLRYLVILAVAMVIAAVLHRLVERPCIRLGRRLARSNALSYAAPAR